MKKEMIDPMGTEAATRRGCGCGADPVRRTALKAVVGVTPGHGAAGHQARARQRRRDGQPREEAGRPVLTGGKIADRPGYHYEPTVLMGCTADMDVMTKECFAPVLPMQVVDSLDEAIALANDSEYGLTSSIFTQNINAAMKSATELSFGETYINREHFEAMQGYHAGRRKSGSGGADGKHGLYDYL
jgi:acyl-CoA reductase-like NAD-dependent aldehyde dehydrogenase